MTWRKQESHQREGRGKQSDRNDGVGGHGLYQSHWQVWGRETPLAAPKGGPRRLLKAMLGGRTGVKSLALS